MRVLPPPRLCLCLGLVFFTALAACSRRLPAENGVDWPAFSSHYLEMDDGVRLAADVWLPPEHEPGVVMPTMVMFTRYWRQTEMRLGPGRPFLVDLDDLATHGYALVYVDVRGTGASFGTWDAPWSDKEVADTLRVFDWIVAQPWSDGQVVTYGFSYQGTIQLLSASTPHPALKAMVPRRSFFDTYEDLAFPGGAFNAGFIGTWNQLDRELDAGEVAGFFPGVARLVMKGVAPVQGEEAALPAALAEHAGNVDVYEGIRQVNFRDEDIPGAPFHMGDVSAHTRIEALNAAQVSIFWWEGWFSAAAADGALSAYHSLDVPMNLVLGPWAHFSRPFEILPGHQEPAFPDETEAIFAFLDHYLRAPGEAEPVPLPREIRYYTFGRGTWSSTPSWPPVGFEPQTWYLGAGHTLTQETATADGSDLYAVDFTATTDEQSRYQLQIYPNPKRADRRKADEHLLVYDSPPLPRAVEVTGHPTVELHLSCSTPETQVIAYLEAVAPDGRVVLLTEGNLSAIHRKLSQPPPGLAVFGPYHSYLQADGAPLVPGQVEVFSFALNPTSVLVPAGWRLRLALAGHDAEVFRRVPLEGEPVWQVQRTPDWPSRLVLPVRWEE